MLISVALGVGIIVGFAERDGVGSNVGSVMSGVVGTLVGLLVGSNVGKGVVSGGVGRGSASQNFCSISRQLKQTSQSSGHKVANFMPVEQLKSPLERRSSASKHMHSPSEQEILRSCDLQ